MFKGIKFFIVEGWRYSKRYILWLVFGELLSAFVPIASALAPRYIIDELTGLQRPDRLIAYVAAFSGYALVAGVLRSYFFRDGFSRRCDVGRQFDLRLNRQLIETDYANIESPAFRDMHEKAQKFLTCDWHGFGYLLDCAVRVIGQAATLVGLMAMLSTLNPGFVMLFALLALSGAWMESRAKRQAMALSMGIVRDQRAMMYFNKVLGDARFGKVIRLGGIGGWILGRYDAFYRRVNDTQRRQNNLFIRSDGIRAGLTFVQQAAAYALLITGVLSGRMSIGEFTMCLTAVAAFYQALGKTMDAVAEIRAYDMYYDHLDAYLSMPRSTGGASAPTAEGPHHRIALEDVSFRYPGADHWALRHISLTLLPGEKLALVGENGSGKTTLIKLLCRLYDPTEGVIRLDGQDIRDIDRDAYLRLFSTVFQDDQLFDFSLRDNITLGRAADDAHIRRICHLVGLEDCLNRLPDGLDTPVGRELDDRGFLPSGGEAQKITLARALFRDAPILILDEPTSALDPRAEYALYRSFDRLTKGRTAVYISHRLSSARFCDRIAVLSGGLLRECGTHDALLRQGGLYADLYAMQAQFYAD